MSLAESESQETQLKTIIKAKNTKVEKSKSTKVEKSIKVPQMKTKEPTQSVVKITKYHYLVRGKVNSKGIRYLYTKLIEAQDESIATSIYKEQAKLYYGNIRNITCITTEKLDDITNIDSESSVEIESPTKIKIDESAIDTTKFKYIAKIDKFSDFMETNSNDLNDNKITKENLGIYYLDNNKYVLLDLSEIKFNINDIIAICECYCVSVYQYNELIWKIVAYRNRRDYKKYGDLCAEVFLARNSTEAIASFKKLLNTIGIKLNRSYIKECRVLNFNEIFKYEKITRFFIKIYTDYKNDNKDSTEKNNTNLLNDTLNIIKDLKNHKDNYHIINEALIALDDLKNHKYSMIPRYE